jgi:hypothetical protein
MRKQLNDLRIKIYIFFDKIKYSWMKYWSKRRIMKWKCIFDEATGLGPVLTGTDKRKDHKNNSYDISAICRARHKSLVDDYYAERKLVNQIYNLDVEEWKKWIEKMFIGWNKNRN